MTEELFIPKLGQTVEEVVLINWLVDDGDKVDFGDPVLEVETDKAIFNIEANAKGFIHFGNHKIGETVPVLTVVATIGKKEEDFVQSDAQTNAVDETNQSPQTFEVSGTSIPSEKNISDHRESTPQEKIFASPRARKLADARNVDLSLMTPTGGNGVRVVEQDVIDFLQAQPKATPLASSLADEVGLDLQGIKGTGPMGSITREDVMKAIRDDLKSSPSITSISNLDIKYSEIAVKERQPIRSVRKLIFDRMAASDQLTVPVTLVTEADATELVRLREKLKLDKADDWGFKPGYNDLIGVIVARTLREFPYMNARLSSDGTSFEFLGKINLGVAMDTDRGLIVPVIRNADQKELKSFGLRFRELVEQTQTGRISPEDLTGGTFTITNLGGFDVDAFTPVINLPEVAILGLGRIQDKVVPYEGEVKVRKMITLSLVFDHRLIDGAPAARFLQKVKEYLEYPVMLFV